MRVWETLKRWINWTPEAIGRIDLLLFRLLMLLYSNGQKKTKYVCASSSSIFIFAWLHFSTANNECQAERQNEGAFEHWIFLLLWVFARSKSESSMSSHFCTIIHHPVVQALQGIFLQQHNVNNETNNEYDFVSIQCEVFIQLAHCDQSIFITRFHVYPNIQWLSIESQTFQMITAQTEKKHTHRKESKIKKKKCDT